jgi:hypothetical protein
MECFEDRDLAHLPVARHWSGRKVPNLCILYSRDFVLKLDELPIPERLRVTEPSSKPETISLSDTRGGVSAGGSAVDERASNIAAVELAAVATKARLVGPCCGIRSLIVSFPRSSLCISVLSKSSVDSCVPANVPVAKLIPEVLSTVVRTLP